MNKMFSSVFGAAGITNITFGNTNIPVAAPKTRKTLKGFGDTIKIGDIAYWESSDGGKSGPFRLEAISSDPLDPWFRVAMVDGSMPVANYVGDTWTRTFSKADKKVAAKVRAALKYLGLYVRVSVAFKVDIAENSTRHTLIPACWVAWVGDLKEALTTHRTPFGKLKTKDIVEWVKTGMFTDGTMRSKVPIPEDFPVSLQG